MLNTSAAIKHSTVIPDGIESSGVVNLLQDHASFFKCFPHMLKYELIDTPTGPESTIAKDRHVKAIAAAKQYQVTDKVPGIPAWLWDTDLVSTYELINIERGVFVRIRGPLNVVLETVWEVRETKDGGTALVSDLVIHCSKLIMGVAKGICEDGPKRIHVKLMKKLRGEDDED
ncbi:hypothetical protein XA68_10346 [Ophiocordyceps unilateralis]|uniref:DUF7053 domain-containing protein n=1 Tax=Ophiocordyceps unilateralis TaxID=268505 RepID=A0A2A9PIC6_OPHUN|nr:hypothetical protein XA68_10346 [Ophiocordyceps unilateralis]